MVKLPLKFSEFLLFAPLPFFFWKAVKPLELPKWPTLFLATTCLFFYSGFRYKGTTTSHTSLWCNFALLLNRFVRPAYSMQEKRRKNKALVAHCRDNNGFSRNYSRRSSMAYSACSVNNINNSLLNMVACFNSLRENPKQLALVLGLSLLNHVFWCAALFCIVMAFNQSIEVAQGFAVFPFAIFSNVFGFAGGFGVGTAAFDVIFSKLLSIQAGATIGLTFQILSALSRLLGLPFYLKSSH